MFLGEKKKHFLACPQYYRYCHYTHIYLAHALANYNGKSLFTEAANLSCMQNSNSSVVLPLQEAVTTLFLSIQIRYFSVLEHNIHLPWVAPDFVKSRWAAAAALSVSKLTRVTLTALVSPAFLTLFQHLSSLSVPWAVVLCPSLLFHSLLCSPVKIVTNSNIFQIPLFAETIPMYYGTL